MHAPRIPTALSLLLAFTPATALAGPATAIGQLRAGAAEAAEVAVTATVSADFREGLGGVFVQDGGDGDPGTPDGLFVRPTEGVQFPEGVAAGHECRFQGRLVEEKRSGSRATVLLAERVDRCRAGQPVAALTLDALPQDWAALDGMRVRIEAPLFVAGTDALPRYGELAVSFDGRLWQPSELARPGTPEHAELAARNARVRLLLDDGSQARDPGQVAYLGDSAAPRVGDVVLGAEGVVEQRHGSWRLQLDRPLRFEAAQRPAPPQVPGNVRVAAFNLENLFNGNGRGGGFPTPRGAKTEQAFEAQLAKLVATVHGLDPDVAALMELENDGYGEDSSIARLVRELNAGGAQWRFVDAGRGPGADTIRVGIIYRADRLVPRGAPAVLEGGPFGERSRVPLAQAFRRKGGGKEFVVVANHFKSKGCSEATGDNADRKDGQGCWNALRLDSAQRLHAWLQSAPLGKGRERVVILGDFNAYAMEDPVRWLREDAGWTDAFAAAGVERPWSYVYQGLSGRLDHALLSPALLPHLRGAAEWHVNADEPDDAGYAGRNVSGPWRSSDHDPLLLGFEL
ncbi:ExeM/NucH family extracellular endonuclease [Pseudoxanthomonas suwonensis]|uniref:ExeM/NucH family extracellular endonuclease n=1 Tax=Pseudoxanthomonas suwonensis TaxID=314722 RepID=UPI00048F3A36|nr:ExeM/NucH family extracellular endonuclease [Pseudoxanthomonas suwonensis]